MMAEDELAELAEDILTNGPLHPIIIDAEGVLIDGRNRLAACEKAGVEPVYQSLNGHEARAFIVSANLARRNLSRGQQAMALAMIYPEPEKGGRGRTRQRMEETSTGFSTKLLQ
jgi:ParB-like chromosome segregation protein Spo0J